MTAVLWSNLHHNNKIPVINKDINVVQNDTYDYFLEHNGVDNSKHKKEINTKYIKISKENLKKR